MHGGYTSEPPENDYKMVRYWTCGHFMATILTLYAYLCKQKVSVCVSAQVAGLPYDEATV